jgi:hypothetical protein
MKKEPMIMFVGAGAVGKTSVLNEYMEMTWEPIVPIKSIIRDFYRSRGYSSQESVGKLSNTEQMHFQHDLMSAYIRNLLNVDRTYPQSILFDRSPFCHLAYVLHAENQVLDPQTPETKYSIVESALSHTNRPIFLFLFDYPQPWMTDKTGEDGFRRYTPQKNSLITSIAFHYAQKFARARPSMCSVTFMPNNSTPEQRARLVNSVIGVYRSQHV